MFDHMVTGRTTGIEFPATYGTLDRYADSLISSINQSAKYNLDEALAAYCSQYLPLFKVNHKSKVNLNEATAKVLEQVTL